MKSIQFNLGQISLALSSIAVLVVMSFRQYFFISPFENGIDVYSWLQLLAVFGWILLIVFPPILLRDQGPWSRGKLYLFLISASLWTASTFAIKLLTLITTGDVWLDYLAVYPIMVYVEWLLPAFYWYLYSQIRKSSES